MYKQFSQGSKHLIKIFALRRTIIKGNFYSVLSKTTLFSANKVSFSLGECPFNNNYYHSKQLFLPFHWPKAHHVTCK